jgi:hypothetical protein
MNMLFDMITEIANLFFSMVMDTGGFGTIIKDTIKMICDLINICMLIYNNTICVMMKDFVYPMLKALVDFLQFLAQWSNSDALTAISTYIGYIVSVIDLMDCTHMFECSDFTRATPQERVGVLPVTSRCWANYVPQVDDASAFTCAASDTCTNADLSFGVRALEFGGIADSWRQVLCNSCPRTSDPNINQFACDTYTKQC